MEDFEDLVEANQRFAETFDRAGLVGRAAAGIAIVTCMDARIEPLSVLGLQPGDAKVLRNPGGRVDHATLDALVLAVHLLGVDRILVIPHTRCAVASASTEEIRARVEESAGQPAPWFSFRAISDQLDSLADDVQKIRTHPLIPDSTLVGGFVYDVDTGVVDRKF